MAFVVGGQPLAYTVGAVRNISTPEIRKIVSTTVTSLLLIFLGLKKVRMILLNLILKIGAVLFKYNRFVF